ncbi:MAG: hypothetical protein PHW00_01445 [Clostridia bacterium]|nr:hypothetical protein [Clostridia bacterium]
MMSFWDYSTWSFVVTISILLFGILIVGVLYNVIKPLKKMLLPESVLAGFLLLGASLIYNLIVPTHAENPMLDTSVLEMLTYHGLGIGFVAIALKRPDKPKDKNNNKDVINSGLITVSGYLIQGIIGLAITLGLSYVITNVFPASGVILPMGYGQGPGQAYNWGKIYMEQWGFENGVSFGLTVASCGFIASAVGGAIYLTRMKKKHGLTLDTTAVQPDEGSIRYKANTSVDNLTIQLSLVLVTYAITYLTMFGLLKLFNVLEPSGDGFLHNTVNPLIWGFNFLLGTVYGTLMRKVIVVIERKRNVEILDNVMLSRISGFAFDIMIVASICAINLSSFLIPSFILPLSLICLAGSVVTYLYAQFACRRLFIGYADEAFLAMYGMLTGTASTGMILLRQIDNEYRTPAAPNVVYQSLYAILFGFPVLLLMTYAPQPLGSTANGWAWLSLGIMTVLFVVYSLILFRGKYKTMWRKVPANQSQVNQQPTDDNIGRTE